MRKKTTYIMLALTAITLMLASCGTKKKAVETTESDNGTAKTEQTELAEKYFSKITANKSTAQNLVAKAHVTLGLGGETLSTNGTLRMRKDDVIQLSLVDPLLGIMELGRMEFTENKVLVIVRVKKLYVEVPYSKVEFLSLANVSFNTLQSLFWNELFEPGYFTPQAESYTYSLNATDVNLNIVDGILRYDFTATQSEGLISKTEITGSKDTTYSLRFDYSQFAQFAKKQFPNSITLTFTDGNKDMTLQIELNSLKDSSDWENRTTVPASYDKADFDTIFKMLVK